MLLVISVGTFGSSVQYLQVRTHYDETKNYISNDVKTSDLPSPPDSVLIGADDNIDHLLL